MDLCFATFTQLIKHHMTLDISNDGITGLLLAYVVVKKDIKSRRGNSFDLTPRDAHRYLNRKAELPEAIRNAAQSLDTEEYGAYLKREVLDKVNDMDDLVNDFKVLINNDSSISDATKDSLLSYEQDDAQFFAEILVYVLGRKNNNLGENSGWSIKDTGWISELHNEKKPAAAEGINDILPVSEQDIQKLWGEVLTGKTGHLETFSVRTLETLKNMSSHEADCLLRIFKVSAIQISFQNEAISEYADIFPFSLSNPVIEVGSTFERYGAYGVAVEKSDGVSERIAIDKFQLERDGYLTSYGFNILQDANLLEYNEKEYSVCLNTDDIGFIAGNIAVVISCTAPIGTSYMFKYKAFEYRRAARELYYAVDFTPDANYLIKAAKDWRSCFRYSNDDRFSVEVHKVNRLDLYNHIVILEDENLLDTESSL